MLWVYDERWRLVPVAAANTAANSSEALFIEWDEAADQWWLCYFDRTGEWHRSALRNVHAQVAERLQARYLQMFPPEE